MKTTVEFTGDMDAFTDDLSLAVRENSLESRFDAIICEKFRRFTQLLFEYNAHTNLTAIRDVREVIVKHIIDSALILRFVEPHLKPNAKILDIGCGAGFPSFPVAMLTDANVTALDSTAKKTAFIESTAFTLGMENINILTGRAEELAKTDTRGTFDMATARAVAKVNVLCELALPLLKQDGVFAAMKTDLSELPLAENACKVLGGEVENAHEYKLVDPFAKESYPRSLVIIRKVQRTPENYPRLYSQIAKNPL